MMNVKKGSMKSMLLILVASLLFFACATKPDVYKEIDEAVGSASFEGALAALEKGQAAKKPIYPKDNTVLLYLDKGVLEHYAEKYDESSQDLQEAERLIEEAYTASVTKGIASYFANDNTREYGGEDYEDIYTNIFGALNYYHKGNVEGAEVEVRKSVEKLKQLEDKYSKEDGEKSARVKPEVITAFVLDAVGIATKAAGLPGFLVPIPDEILKPDPVPVPFTDSALAEYLITIFNRDGANPDGARIALVNLNKAVLGTSVPASLQVSGEEGYETAEELNVPAGKARLNFIGFAGLSPIKAEKIEDLDFVPNGVPIFPSIGSLKPLDNEKRRLTVGNMAMPELLPRPSVVESVEVDVGGQKVQLELLEDIGKVIEGAFNVKVPSLRTKAYIRAILKYVAVEVAAQVAINQGLPELAVIAAVAGAKKGVDASERADIRAGRYLPGKAFVGGITLDPGTYDVTFNFANGGTVTKNITVAAGKTNLVEAFDLK
jgi:hypothetical protein